MTLLARSSLHSHPPRPARLLPPHLHTAAAHVQHFGPEVHGLLLVLGIRRQAQQVGADGPGQAPQLPAVDVRSQRGLLPYAGLIRLESPEVADFHHLRPGRVGDRGAWGHEGAEEEISKEIPLNMANSPAPDELEFRF